MAALAMALQIALLVFVLSSMLSAGLGLTIVQITAPLRNHRLAAMSLVANFVLVPAVSVGLAHLMHLDEPRRVGLVLLGVAAGAPFLIKLAQIAHGNLAFAVALMIMLMVFTVGYLPVAMPLLLPGASVNPAKIAISLVLLMVLPLLAALLVNRRRPAFAVRVKPVFDRLSTLALLLVVVLQIVVRFDDVLSVFGTGAILAGVLLTVLGYAVGWVCGGPAADTRIILGLGTAQRNIAAALVVAGQNFSDPAVVVMVVVVAIVSFAVLLPASRVLARRGTV